MDISQNYPGPQLRSELARYCLPSASRDASRKLAWVNSICILFLLIGVTGGRQTSANVKPPPPLEEIIPTVIEQLPPPPVARIEATTKEETEPQKDVAPQVVAVTINSPAVNFSVPTIGNLIVPQGRAVAPPSNPMNQLVAATGNIISIGNSGKGGDRPAPEYPRIAQDLHQEGTVALEIMADANGRIIHIEILQSSGFSILDHSTLEFVKRHWILPAGVAGQRYEAPFKYTFPRK